MLFCFPEQYGDESIIQPVKANRMTSQPASAKDIKKEKINKLMNEIIIPLIMKRENFFKKFFSKIT